MDIVKVMVKLIVRTVAEMEKTMKGKIVTIVMVVEKLVVITVEEVMNSVIIAKVQERQ